MAKSCILLYCNVNEDRLRQTMSAQGLLLRTEQELQSVQLRHFAFYVRIHDGKAGTLPLHFSSVGHPFVIVELPGNLDYSESERRALSELKNSGCKCLQLAETDITMELICCDSNSVSRASSDTEGAKDLIWLSCCFSKEDLAVVLRACERGLALLIASSTTKKSRRRYATRAKVNVTAMLNSSTHSSSSSSAALPNSWVGVLVLAKDLLKSTSLSLIHI